MSFGIGLGDVFQLTKLIITTIRDIHSAPQELQQLAARVDSVAATLELLRELPYASGSKDGSIDNEPLAKSHDVAEFQKRQIKETLSGMQKIVLKYKDTSVLNRGKYLLSSKGNLSDLDTKLSQQTQDLTTLLTIQNGLLTSQLRPLIEQVLLKQDQASEKEGKRRAAAHGGNISGLPRIPGAPRTMPEKVDQVQTALNTVMNSTPSGIAKSIQNDTFVQNDIETRLRQAGLNIVDIDALVKMIVRQRESLTHPEDIDITLAAGGKKRSNGPSGWIMMVDNHNTVSSIIAQTYLELVRIWTVNTTGDWLFKRVESAGVQVATKFSQSCSKFLKRPFHPGGDTPENAAIEAIAGRDEYFKSTEKDDVLARIRTHRSRGIDDWHFRKYDYMLCFSKSAFDALQVLETQCWKKNAKNPSHATPAKVLLVCNLVLDGTVESLTKAQVKVLVDTIKSGLQDFLTKAYGWKRPQRSIVQGPFRTQQIVLPSTKIMGLEPDVVETKLHDIKNQTECRIRITHEKFGSQLFSITGRKEALPLAVSLLTKWLI